MRYCRNIPYSTGLNPTTDPAACQCNAGYTWSTAAYPNLCSLNCGTVGNIDTNSCNCTNGTVYNPNSGTCQINCQNIANSPQTNIDQFSCACNINFKWVLSIKKCVRDCSTDIHSNGTYNPSDLTQCNCNTGYVWNTAAPYQNLCMINCLYIQNSNGNSAVDACLCVTNFKWETNAGANQNTCVRDCSNQPNSNGYNVNFPYQCNC